MPYAKWVPGKTAVMKCGHEADSEEPFSGHPCCSLCFAKGKVWDSQILDRYELKGEKMRSKKRSIWLYIVIIIILLNEMYGFYYASQHPSLSRWVGYSVGLLIWGFIVWRGLIKSN